MEVILYSKECNWYTRCCPLNGGVRYRECPLREAILYMICLYCKLTLWVECPLGIHLQTFAKHVRCRHTPRAGACTPNLGLQPKERRGRESIKHYIMRTYSCIKSTVFYVRSNDSISTDDNRERLVKPAVVQVTVKHVTGLLCKVLRR